MSLTPYQNKYGTQLQRKTGLAPVELFSFQNELDPINSTQSMKKSDFPCHGIITGVFFPMFFFILYLPVVKKNNVLIQMY